MVNKITSPITPLEEVAKINEVIDAIPTESTVSGWGFTKNAGTVTSVNNVSPVNGNVSLTIPTVNNATLTITQGGTTKGTFTANASSDVTIALDAGGGSSGSAVRNIGEIVTSTIPLSDAGLHLLDGGVISSSGAYSAFVTYIANLVSGHSELFTTEANWQTSVTNYGVCGKFVYDSQNNTVRLPKYGSQIISSLPQDIAVKGNGMTLGLTDGSSTGNGLISQNNGALLASSNNAYGTTVGGAHSGKGYGNNISVGITTDPTKSGIIANTSDIPTEDCYYYIVIATSTKTSIEVDIDEIATDLNGKADVDLSNCTTGSFENLVGKAQTSGKNTIVGWGMPDFSAGVSFSGTITLNCDALVFATASGGGSWVGAGFRVNGVQIYNSSAYACTACCCVAKGSTVERIEGTCSYYPLKGVN